MDKKLSEKLYEDCSTELYDSVKKIAAVSELIKKWRKKARGAEDNYDRVRNNALEYCANGVEAILKKED